MAIGKSSPSWLLQKSGKSVASQKMENSEHIFGEDLSRKKKKEEEIALQSS